MFWWEWNLEKEVRVKSSGVFRVWWGVREKRLGFVELGKLKLGFVE